MLWDTILGRLVSSDLFFSFTCLPFLTLNSMHVDYLWYWPSYVRLVMAHSRDHPSFTILDCHGIRLVPARESAMARS